MDFKQYLDTLRLSAKDAIVDGEQDSLSDLKKYLHIEREVEHDLGKLIFSALEAPAPRLIFLMGNVGDGKSHLLAKMWQLHTAEMQQFKVLNDATESVFTDMTYLQHLENVLRPYSDAMLGSDGEPVKTIVAINLGTLTNFLEECGEGYQRMKAFVADNQLVERKINFLPAAPDTNFLALNLTDYHIFSLGAAGANCQVLTDIVERITRQSPDNPFFEAYQRYVEAHPAPGQCPLCYNFSFLAQPAAQLCLSELLVKVVLSDKLIVSVRLLMNWIYDLLVSPSLSSLTLTEVTELTATPTFASEFYHHTLPVLLFEGGNTSFILRSLRAHDPVSTTNEQLEMLLIKLGASNTPGEYFSRYRLLPPEGMMERLIPFLETRQQLQLFLRLHYLLRRADELASADPYFRDFLQNLYWFNTGQVGELLPFYNQVRQAIYQWNGTAVAGDDFINLNVGRKQSVYKVSQKLQLQPAPPDMGKAPAGVFLQKFAAFLVAGFRVSAGGKPLELEIDYNLYQLVRQINAGYRPNRIDKNIHLKFSQFVTDLIRYESQFKELIVQEFTGEVRKKFKLQFTPGFNHFQFSEIS